MSRAQRARNRRLRLYKVAARWECRTKEKTKFWTVSLSLNEYTSAHSVKHLSTPFGSFLYFTLAVVPWYSTYICIWTRYSSSSLSLCLCFFVVLFVYVVDCWFALVTFSWNPPPAWPFALFCFVFVHLSLLFCLRAPSHVFALVIISMHPFLFFLISPCSSLSFPNQPANKPSKCKHCRKRRLRLNMMKHFLQAGWAGRCNRKPTHRLKNMPTVAH